MRPVARLLALVESVGGEHRVLIEGAAATKVRHASATIRKGGVGRV